MTRLRRGVCVSGKVCLWIATFIILTGCGSEAVRSVGTNGVKDETKNQPNSNGGNASSGSTTANGANSSSGTTGGTNSANNGSGSGTTGGGNSNSGNTSNVSGQNGNTGNTTELNIQIGRVCSSARSTSPLPFFEELTADKIVSVELLLFDASAMNSQIIPNIRYTPIPAMNRIVLGYQSLSSVDLDQSVQRVLSLNINQLSINSLNSEQRTRSFILLTACLDRNHNGMCSDELYADSLTLRREPGVFSLAEIQSPIELLIYHGRFRNQAGSPNLCEIQGAN